MSDFLGTTADIFTLGLRKPLKKATGMSDAQLALAAAAAATGGAAAGGFLGGGAGAAGGAAGGTGMQLGAGGMTGMSMGGGSTGMTLGSTSGLLGAPAAPAAPASGSLLGTVNQSLMAANSAKGLLGGQSTPVQASPVMPSQGGPQALQGIAAQGDQLTQQRMQADEQARQQRRMGLLQGGMRNGRIA